jgi:hypothetical protein
LFLFAVLAPPEFQVSLTDCACLPAQKQQEQQEQLIKGADFEAIRYQVRRAWNGKR